MLRRISVSLITGSLLLFTSLLVISGWLIKNPVLVSVLPEHIYQVFNSALCFFLSAVAVVLPDHFPRLQIILRRAAGLLVLSISLLTLSQHVFHFTAGVDQLFSVADMDIFNPYPGRMGLSTALLFIMVGGVFAFWPEKPHQFWVLFARLTIFSMLLIGFVTVTGYWLKLEFLYHTHLFMRVSLYSGINFLILGGALWSVSYQHMRLIPFYHYRDDAKILLVSGTILFFVALAGELSGFSVYSSQNESTLKNIMQQALINRVNAFNDHINMALKEVNSIVKDAHFQKILQNSSQRFEELNLLFMSRGFSAITITNSEGKRVYAAGNPTVPSESLVRLPMVSTYNAELLWRDRWVLRIFKKLQYQGVNNGTLTVEFPLGNLLLKEQSQDLGDSGRFLICAMDGDHIACSYRQRDQGPVLKIYPISKKYVSINNALLGKKGESIEIDSNNNEVLTAYSPIGSLGLGAVVVMDTAELYSPVRGQLEIIIPIFLLSISVGMLLLSWQVSPLVRRIVISEKKALHSNARLRESESRFRSVFEMSAIGMALVSMEGKWLRVNAPLCQLLGYSEAELLCMSFQSMIHADDLGLLQSKLLLLRHGQQSGVRAENRILAKNKIVLWTLMNASIVYDSNNKPLYYIFQIQDIDKQKQAENLLKKMAYHDPLTALDNRSEIEKNINSAILASNLSRHNFALLFLDLDHFKEVNDNYGHDIGDLLLKEMAARLRRCTRRTDKIGRLGGDEFVVLLGDLVDAKNVRAIAEKILHTLSAPFVTDEINIRITTSVGISIYPDDGLSVETLIKHADVALYCAKEFGKNNYQFFGGVGIQP